MALTLKPHHYLTAMPRKANTTEAPLIFIVDDVVSVRRSAGRFVRSLGMPAETLASAQDLLNSRCVADAARLILDVRMPNIDGPELQRRLRETRQRIPAVFISARLPKKRKTATSIRGSGFFAQAHRKGTSCCA
jgi:CheY-like chemotaxis protein